MIMTRHYYPPLSRHLAVFVALVVLVESAVAKESLKGKRIAIVGGGICASSAAFHLHHHLLHNPATPSLQIDVIEASHVGDSACGRLKYSLAYGEMGGAVFHGRNRYVHRFLQFLQLKKTEPSYGRDARACVYTGAGTNDDPYPYCTSHNWVSVKWRERVVRRKGEGKERENRYKHTLLKRECIERESVCV
jgi:hypothetical protein